MHHSYLHTGKPRTGMISKLEFLQGTIATHILECKNKHDQQARIVARNHSHSQTGEPRTCMINRL